MPLLSFQWFSVILPLSRGGDEGVRTPDPLRARQVLSQLSYTPIDKGSIFTSLLKIFSSTFVFEQTLKIKQCFRSGLLLCFWSSLGFVWILNFRFCCFRSVLHRKEVIQPHLPIRLPCYDFTPIIVPTFDDAFLRWAIGFGC